MAPRLYEATIRIWAATVFIIFTVASMQAAASEIPMQHNTLSLARDFSENGGASKVIVLEKKSLTQINIVDEVCRDHPALRPLKPVPFANMVLKSPPPAALVVSVSKDVVGIPPSGPSHRHNQFGQPPPVAPPAQLQ